MTYTLRVGRLVRRTPTYSRPGPTTSSLLEFEWSLRCACLSLLLAYVRAPVPSRYLFLGPSSVAFKAESPAGIAHLVAQSSPSPAQWLARGGRRLVLRRLHLGPEVELCQVRASRSKKHQLHTVQYTSLHGLDRVPPTFRPRAIVHPMYAMPSLSYCKVKQEYTNACGTPNLASHGQPDTESRIQMH